MNRKNLEQERSSAKRFWIYSINIAIFVIICFFIFSFWLGIKETMIMKFEFSIKWMNDFIEKFYISIKIGAAIIAILTIKVYFSNNNQTERIIKETIKQSENYVKSENLKNYFLHRKEFRLYVQELDFFKKLKEIESFNFYSTWDILYKTFYDGDYKNFEPKLMKNEEDNIITFINSIQISSINTVAVPSFEKEDLEKIVSNILPSTKEFIENIASLQVDEYYNIYQNSESKILTDLAVKILIAKQLYESILSFNGKKITQLDTFDKNINKYFNNLKINT
jgi:hypothetical protein